MKGGLKIEHLFLRVINQRFIILLFLSSRSLRMRGASSLLRHSWVRRRDFAQDLVKKALQLEQRMEIPLMQKMWPYIRRTSKCRCSVLGVCCSHRLNKKDAALKLDMYLWSTIRWVIPKHDRNPVYKYILTQRTWTTYHANPMPANRQVAGGDKGFVM